MTVQHNESTLETLKTFATENSSRSHRRTRNRHHELQRFIAAKIEGLHVVHESRPRSWRIRGRRRCHSLEVDKRALLARHAHEFSDMSATDHGHKVLLVGALEKLVRRRRRALMPSHDDSGHSITLSVGVHPTIVADHEDKGSQDSRDGILGRNSPIIGLPRDARDANSAPANRTQPNTLSGHGRPVMSQLPRRQPRSRNLGRVRATTSSRSTLIGARALATTFRHQELTRARTGADGRAIPTFTLGAPEQ